MSGGGGSGNTQFNLNPFAGVPAGAEGLGFGGPATGGVSGPAGNGGQDLVCESLTFVARLRNVDAGEVQKVEVGDVLSVEFRTDPSPMVAVARILADGTTATTALGALLSRLGELLPCLATRPFVAVVESINGGDVRVRVSAPHQ